MSRMSLETAIRLSAEVKGANKMTKVQRSLQDLAQGSRTTARDMQTLRAATFQYARANDGTIAGIRNSITAFRGLQEQAKIGSREFQRYGSEIQKLEGKLRGIDGTAEKAGRSLGQNLAAGLAAAGVGQALRAITMQAGKFDAEVRKAAAIEGGAGSFGVLQKEIEKVAAAAAGTPTEVAALATALSRAGFSAKETTEALAGIVRGAEATSVTFEEMGSIAADNLRAFGLQTNDTARVVDVLTQTANKSNQTVLDLGESMKYAAPIARSLGVPLEDLAAVMGLLANNGIRGSDAGTALRTGLTRLQIAAGGADSEIADLTRGNVQLTKAMATLGSEILDTNGKLRPLDQVLSGLKKSLSTLSATDQAILAKALFGTEAGSKFQALLNSTEGQVKQMFAAIRDSGGVAEKTQKQMQGFDYSVKVLGGNFEYLTNQIGGAIGLALKPFIDVLNAAIGAAQTLPGPIKAIGAAAAGAGISTLGLVAAIAALKAGLALLGGATAIKAAITGVLSFGGAATTATGAITGLKAAMLAIPGVGWAAAAIVGTGLLGKAVYDTNETFRNFVDNIGGVLAADFRNAVDGMAADARSSANDIEKSYKDLATRVNPAAEFIRELFKDVFKDTSDSAKISATQSSNAFSEFFASLSTSATAGFAGLNTIIGNWWNSLPEPIRNIFGGNAVSMLTGAAQYASGAASRAAAPNAQASGMYGRYAPGGAQVPFAQPAAARNAMDTPIGAVVGGGGGVNTIAGIEKSIKALKELQEQAVIGSSDFNRYGAELQRLEARLKNVTGETKKLSQAEINRRALLATVRFAEGTLGPKGYGTHFGGSYTPPGGAHPNRVIRKGGYASAAFGAYQFMPDTWRGVGGGNMTPARQDEAALRLIRNRGVDPDQPLNRSMIDKLAPEWASFPTLKTGTSYYGQGGKSFTEIEKFYRQQVERGGGDVASLDLETGKAQADAAEKMQQQLKAAESINVALKDRLAIAQTTEPVARQMLEYDIEQNQLAREYQDLRDAAAGPDELILINANLIVEQRIKQIEHEEKLNNLLAERATLMANVAAQAAMPTVYNELETQEAALQAVLDKYPAIGAAADAAATLATSGVSEMIAGTKDAKEVFVDFLGSIADALMDTAKQMIAQYIAIGIAKMFAGMGGGGGGGGGFAPSGDLAAVGNVGTGFNFDVGAMSFAGGGYTGNAPRAGGIDGQGGFPAILHPQETVIDHTRAMAVPYQRSAAAAAPPAMEVPYQRSGPAMAVPFQKSAGGAAGDSVSTTIDVKFETVRIGGVDYVTRDEAEQIGRESAQRGADLAHKRFRNSPSARRAAGMG